VTILGWASLLSACRTCLGYAVPAAQSKEAAATRARLLDFRGLPVEPIPARRQSLANSGTRVEPTQVKWFAVWHVDLATCYEHLTVNKTFLCRGGRYPRRTSIFETLATTLANTLWLSINAYGLMSVAHVSTFFVEVAD